MPRIGRRNIELSAIPGMSEEDYQATVSYIKQWDDPSYAEFLAQVQVAREGVSADPEVVAEPEDVEESDGLEEMTNDELRELLKDRDLPVSGNKEELVARLRGEEGETAED